MGMDSAASAVRNRPAIIGLIVGILGLLGPIVLRAAIQTAHPHTWVAPFPIETLVFAVATLVLALRGRHVAADTGAGRKTALWALAIGVLCAVSALGQFGTVSNHY